MSSYNPIPKRVGGWGGGGCVVGERRLASFAAVRMAGPGWPALDRIWPWRRFALIGPFTRRGKRYRWCLHAGAVPMPRATRTRHPSENRTPVYLGPRACREKPMLGVLKISQNGPPCRSCGVTSLRRENQYSRAPSTQYSRAPSTQYSRALSTQYSRATSTH